MGIHAVTTRTLHCDAAFGGDLICAEQFRGAAGADKVKVRHEAKRCGWVYVPGSDPMGRDGRDLCPLHTDGGGS